MLIRKFKSGIIRLRKKTVYIYTCEEVIRDCAFRRTYM